MKFPTPYNDRVLVEDPPHMAESKGGIILVGGKNVDVVCSTIRAVGPNVKDKSLKPGDRVLHTRVTGVKWEGFHEEGLPRGHYRIIKDTELLAVLAPKAVFEGGTGQFDERGEFHTERS